MELSQVKDTTRHRTGLCGGPKARDVIRVKALQPSRGKDQCGLGYILL